MAEIWVGKFLKDLQPKINIQISSETTETFSAKQPKAEVFSSYQPENVTIYTDFGTPTHLAL